MNYPKTSLTLWEAPHKLGRPPLDPAVRFWRHVERGDGCWIWQGAILETGYGAFWHDGRVQKAHRVAWELTNGPVPAGVRVLHQCDNPPCCNPAHLFLGSMADNSRDMVAKGRGPKGVEPRLTDEQVRTIRRLRAQGVTLARIAEIVGCHWVTVCNIAKGKRRANVADVPDEAAS